jgi:TonB family protein
MRTPLLWFLALMGAPLAAQDSLVYLASQVDLLPRRLSGPELRYPAEVLRHGDPETVLVEVIIDTAGRIEPSSFRIIETPDSSLNVSVRAALLGNLYSPALLKGRAVRLLIRLQVILHSDHPVADRPDATRLTTEARGLTARHRPESALALLAKALDTTAHPTEGERVYVLLVRGIAESQLGRTDAAQRDFRAGVALRDRLVELGTELAPMLNDLADSIRLTGAGRHAVAGGGLVVLGVVDVRPEVVSRPPVTYPAEARALGVVGTVVVEAEVDTAGRVDSSSVRVVESPNPLLNAAAAQIVRASRFRPARRAGRAVAVRIRQAVTFRP